MSFNVKCPFHTFSAGVAVAVAVPFLVNLFNKPKVPYNLKYFSNYSKELSIAVSSALEAGKNMLKVLNDEKQEIEKKSTNIDFATDTDRENERLIFDKLRNSFPDHILIGEESVSAANANVNDVTSKITLTDSPTWIVDPIDGTTNFVHSFPFTCVSIAHVINKEPVVGVVYCPSTDELYIAIKGKGAYLNGKPIKVSNVTSLSDALVLTEFGYSRESKDIDKWMVCARSVLLRGAHALRMMGSGVLDLCYIAAGRLDALYAGVQSEGWKPWDYAAGQLIVTEAGGVMKSIWGDEFNMMGKSVLASATEELSNDLVQSVGQGLRSKYLYSASGGGGYN